MKPLSITCLIAALLCLWAPGLGAQDSGFIVVVHPDNPVQSLSKAEVSDIFLKKVTRWESFRDGERTDRRVSIEAVDQESTAPVRDGFSVAIHGRTVDRIKAYWQRRIFSGRDVPPPELASDSDVLDWVRNHPGGIGYVTPSASLSGVKALTIAP